MKKYIEYIKESVKNTDIIYLLVDQKLDELGNPVVNKYFRKSNLYESTDLEKVIENYVFYTEHKGTYKISDLKIIKVETTVTKSYVSTKEIDMHLDAKKYNM